MKRTLIFHPFLFAGYTVLELYRRNLMHVPVEWIIRPLLVIALITAVVYFVLFAITNDKQYAGFLTTLAVIWSFFGQIQRELFERSPFWDTSSGMFIAFIAWTALFVFMGNRRIWSWFDSRTSITSLLNLISCIVLLFPTYVTGRSIIEAASQRKIYESRGSLYSPLVLDPPATRPDIYLIILDAYGREDFLRENYGYDNGEFIGFLKDRGFFVADSSTSNYPQTLLSLPSALNMQYLDGLTEGLEDVSSRAPVQHYFLENMVTRSLQNAGYTIVALRSATLSTQLRDADYYVDMAMVGDLNEFEGLMLSSTVAGPVIDAWELNLPVPSYRMHRQNIYFSLDTLETVVDIQGPKFVFSHILAPHPPFVLDAVGNPIQPERPFSLDDATAYKGTNEEYVSGYTDQVSYLNRRLMQVIDSILANSELPPIIIIQGDHGSGINFDMAGINNTCLKERYSILNAYYFPDGNYDALYPTITPVNSFRVVFNQYFGTELDVLDDRNYFATWLSPYLYSDVSDEVRSCEIPPD
jgi:hypothetical protein